jgi:hypothetical protein
MLGFEFDLGSSSVDCNMAPVRKRLESEQSESPPSLELTCDLSVSSDENYRDPAPATTQSRTSAKKLPFSTLSKTLTSCACGGSSHDGNELKLSMVVKELQPTNEKKVRFDTCTLRFMPLIAGDHPDCVEGPPVRFIV